ncbi:DMT family transporter [Cupriavidus basilensis]|uniref:Permease of the drug/metabolite transporter (DMT) superfamily n=1 Tax=Cupriavidus basilensis TaxID=68895 RepID=A0A0C4YR20_9BURK|nr:DMT family transporter [Cupriavidus basilensis]AJG24920.1 Permease of the drug/metabolite transporter (DMT) superfamily [Cupriavidus basilensis]
MDLNKNALSAHGSTALFVLLWSSGAIFARLGLEYASAFALLAARFALALAVLLVLAAWRRRWLPRPGTRLQVVCSGLLLTGAYSIFYLLALARGMTPGVLATLLGVQPILTLLLVERCFSARRLAGLAVALGGLVLVVFQGIALARISLLGMGFALGALACMTIGAILQKRIRQAPLDVMPLQYGAGLALCLLFVPFQPMAVVPSAGFALSLGWLALVISVGATLLLYRLIQAGNLVNVTSLFYLVPAVTALMDYLFLGNRLAALSLAGMVAIVLGLVLVFSQKAGSPG